jgi:hypothetical protein
LFLLSSRNLRIISKPGVVCMPGILALGRLRLEDGLLGDQPRLKKKNQQKKFWYILTIY